MIFVTGGTGLVGSHLLFELVSREKKVIALKRKSSNIEKVKKIFGFYSQDIDELFSKISWIDGDILDYDSLEDALNGVNEIYHTAAVVSFNPKEKELVKNNIEGTKNIVNAALERNINKLCFVSSVSALGKASDNGEINENCKWSKKHSNSVYSYSKFKSEMEVWRGIAEGLNAVIVNPSIILGPGFWERGSSSFFKVAWKGIKFYTKGQTGFIDVRDIVKIMIELMDKNIMNERFLLNTENLSYKQLLSNIANGFNKKPPSIYISPFITELTWRISKIISFITGKPPLLSKETARSGHSVSNFSNRKIVERLDYKFIPISKSIQDNCKIYLSQFRS